MERPTDSKQKIKVNVQVIVDFYPDGKFYFDANDVADEIYRKLNEKFAPPDCERVMKYPTTSSRPPEPDLAR